MSKGNRYKIIASKKKKPNLKNILLLIVIIILVITCVKHVISCNSKEEEQIEKFDEFSQEIEKAAEVSSTIEDYINGVMLENGLSEENFGFFYYNLDTGIDYFYNEDNWFTAGSTIKVALAMMYYDRINDGEITENTTYKYYSYDYEEGDGLTAYYYSAGDNVPLSFLLEQMIVNSDNTATNILISGMRNGEL